MVRFKASKKQSTGKDFKKIKRKIGRKLPPAQNSTNTEIKSKAIILREQSVAVDKHGLAVSRKGLTLKELLQQSSHHNAKIRKDALLGLKDLLLAHPMELKSHKYTVIEKLRERFNDDNKLVRETLYLLFNSVILPGCKEENLGALISLLMSYVFHAMTNLSIDVRWMAFKFLDLFVQHHPPMFHQNAEKILQNYEDILQKNKFHLEDKGKLRTAISGLLRCLSLLSSGAKEDSSGQHITKRRNPHAYEPCVPKNSTGRISIIRRLNYIIPVLVIRFDDFLSMANSQPLLDGQSFDCMLSILRGINFAVSYFVLENGKDRLDHVSTLTEGTNVIKQDHDFCPIYFDKLFKMFPVRPTHHLSEKDDDRYFTLNLVISEMFFNLSRSVAVAPVHWDRFLTFIEWVFSDKITEIGHLGQAFEKSLLSLVSFLPDLVENVRFSWRLRLLQAFTRTFKTCSPSSSMKMSCLSAIEKMLLTDRNIESINACDPDLLVNEATWIQELPSLLILLGDAYPTCSKMVLRLLLRLGQVSVPGTFMGQEYDKIQSSLPAFYGDGSFGPFMRIPEDCQKLSICCLYYFSPLNPSLLTSVASCCLCHDLKVQLSWIIDVLHSAYKAGHIQIQEHISFLMTIVSQYKVIPEKLFTADDGETASNRDTIKTITRSICSKLCQMGDKSLLFQLLEEFILDMMSSKLPLDNTCAMLRIIIVLNDGPIQFSERNITRLSNILLWYLIDNAIGFPEEADSSGVSTDQYNHQCYYLLPCFMIFYRSPGVLKSMLGMMNSSVFVGTNSRYSKEISGDISRRIRAIVSVVVMILKEVKLQGSLLACKVEINGILESITSLQSQEEVRMSLEQRHSVKSALDRLKIMQQTMLR